MISDVVKVFLPFIISFCIGIAITPFWTHYLYANKLWKKKAGKLASDGTSAVVFNEIHKDKEVGTPRLGGVIIWASAIITIALFWLSRYVLPEGLAAKIDFLSRSQTWIPLVALIIGALIGYADDMMEIKGSRDHHAGGLSLRKRLAIVTAIGLSVGAWFFYKLDVVSIGIPFYGPLFVGFLIIPIFIFVLLAIYASGVIDGIDGLSGGVFASAFAAYAGIAFFQDQYDIAAFSATITGGILAFLWFNIPPARFYMTETGSMALTITLGIVAFMTDSLGGGIGLLILPIVALPLAVTVFTNVLQVLSKRIRGKKIFHVAPIHHHFEALGWPSYKVTMRYWIISVVSAIFGIVIALLA
ncbi:MAG TPA: hypothetical protein PLF31_00390 [Candidatus Paceibacterota bacterium]|nr:hypothetical protein [Candidatus Paceibacterota bacterium]